MSPSATTDGRVQSGSDAKLTVLAGGLVIGEAAVSTDDITLGSGNLTLNVTGNMTQTAGNVITAAGLQIGRASCRDREEISEDAGSLTKRYSETISYTDASALTVGTVTDTEMRPGSTTRGSSSNNSDVKLTVLAGGLVIGEAAVSTDDITLGAGNLTLNVTGNVTQTAGNVITAAGL